MEHRVTISKLRIWCSKCKEYRPVEMKEFKESPVITCCECGTMVGLYL